MNRLLLAATLAAAVLFGVRPSLVHAQGSAFSDKSQTMAVLPDTTVTPFLFDGELYCHVGGTLLHMKRQGSDVVAVEPDTVFVKIDDNIEYIVRQPVTGDLYFTATNRKGQSQLYLRKIEDGKKPKNKHVDLDGLEVRHPTFSDDGRIMVFSTTGRSNSANSYDLWYVTLGKSGWDTPHSIGNRINTRADETDPFIADGRLYFTSSGRDDGDSHPHLYATPLVAQQVESDTVGMLPVGRGRVSRLPQPFNRTAAASASLLVDSACATAYWILSPDGEHSHRPLRSFTGSLDSRLLWGYAHSSREVPIAGAEVTLLLNGKPLCRTLTDSLGFYSLSLPAHQTYTLQYSKPGCFTVTKLLPPLKGEDENLVVEEHRDIVLEGLPFGTQLQYLDLFGPGVSLDLSPRGIETLSPLVRFLCDNPTCSVTLTLGDDITADEEFNSLLTAHRLERLKSHLEERLPATVKLLFRSACDGSQKCASASGISRLTVVINP